jgi:sugar phosphate isomerase/epimerase
MIVDVVSEPLSIRAVTVPQVTVLEHLTLLGVSPPDLVAVSAGAGFSAVGLRVSPATDDDRRWPMTPGSPMLTETVRRCADTGITVLDVEAFRLGRRPAPVTPVLETAAALGAGFLNVVCDDPDLSRFAAQFARLVEAARPYAIRPVIEFMAYRAVRTLGDATAVASGSGGGGILIDALHVRRCGVSLGALHALDPALVTYVQLCDAPAAAPADQVSEARSGRLLPGEGELPLPGLLAALPAGIPVAVEAPQPAAAADPAVYAGRARRALASVLSQATRRDDPR